jgi:transposase
MKTKYIFRPKRTEFSGGCRDIISHTVLLALLWWLIRRYYSGLEM